MQLPTQTEDELNETAREYSERGRILKVRQLATRDKRPFWLLTIRMTRFLEVVKDFSVELEETKGVWTFVSWREIINAEPDRIIYFDLAGRVWRDCEEIASASIDWTTKLKPLEQEPVKVPAKSTRAVERYAPSRTEKARYALQKGALPLERGLQKFTFDKATGLSVYSGKFDHRVWQALLVCAAKVVESNPGTKFDSAEEFQAVYEFLHRMGLDKDLSLVPSIYVTDRDVRRLLHRPKMSSKGCENLLGLLAKLVLRFNEFEGLAMEKDGKRVWKKYSVDSIDGFAGIRVERSQHMKRGRGAGEEERAYYVYFNSKPALAFFHNLSAGAYSLLTNDGVAGKFLGLPGSAQMIICAVWSWKDDKPAILNASQWFAVMGWKRAEREDNYLAQLKRFEKILRSLVKEGFISGWKRFNGGVYQLDKIKALKSPSTTIQTC